MPQLLRSPYFRNENRGLFLELGGLLACFSREKPLVDVLEDVVDVLLGEVGVNDGCTGIFGAGFFPTIDAITDVVFALVHVANAIGPKEGCFGVCSTEVINEFSDRGVALFAFWEREDEFGRSFVVVICPLVDDAGDDVFLLLVIWLSKGPLGGFGWGDLGPCSGDV